MTEVSDDQAFLELGKEFAPEMVTGFIMLDGFAAGVVANVPGEHLSAHGCKKAARFVRLMDAYDIPVVTIVDNEGIDAAAESCCMLRSLAQLAYAYGEAGCPMVSILKKSDRGKAIPRLRTSRTAQTSYTHMRIPRLAASQLKRAALYFTTAQRAEPANTRRSF